jgi:HPt (histidine-containing phosphotransfer) domain-containing protein
MLPGGYIEALIRRLNPAVPASRLGGLPVTQLVKSMLDDPTPAAAAPADRLRLQPEALQALRALDPDGSGAFLTRVLSTYLGSLEKHLQAMPKAVQTDDSAAFVLSVHSLKSASASVGAGELALRCAALEGGLREQPAGPVWQALRTGTALAALQDLAQDTRQAVEAALLQEGRS